MGINLYRHAPVHVQKLASALRELSTDSGHASLPVQAVTSYILCLKIKQKGDSSHTLQSSNGVYRG